MDPANHDPPKAKEPALLPAPACSLVGAVAPSSGAKVPSGVGSAPKSFSTRLAVLGRSAAFSSETASLTGCCVAWLLFWAVSRSARSWIVHLLIQGPLRFGLTVAVSDAVSSILPGRGGTTSGDFRCCCGQCRRIVWLKTSVNFQGVNLVSWDRFFPLDDLRLRLISESGNRKNAQLSTIAIHGSG